MSGRATSVIAISIRGVASGVRRHRLFASFLFIAIVLRILVTLAYQPALLFEDSVDYLARANDLTPSAWHPMGYPLFLRLLRPIGDVAAVPVTQHLLVLVCAVLLYVLLLRLGVRRWLAALGTAPVLFDAFQLNAEQWVLSEALFESLLIIGLVVLLWNAKPRLWQCGVAGFLLALAAITRFDGAVCLAPAVVYVVIRRVGILRIATLVLACTLPIVAYMGWYDSVNGQFTTSSFSSLFLYGRISQIAECKGLSLPSYERPLCPSEPPVDRPPGNWYVSSFSSPARTLRAHDGLSPSSILTKFDLTIIEHQPFDLLNHALDDYLRQFEPTHASPATLAEPNTFFQIGYPTARVKIITNAAATAAINTYFGGPSSLSASTGLDRFLHDYQIVFYTWGPLLALFQVLGLLALLGVGKARSSGRRAECFVLWSSGILVFFVTVLAFEFQFRYLLPTLFLIPPAAALSVAMIWPRFRSDVWERRNAVEPQRETEPGSPPETPEDDLPSHNRLTVAT